LHLISRTKLLQELYNPKPSVELGFVILQVENQKVGGHLKTARKTFDQVQLIIWKKKRVRSFLVFLEKMLLLIFLSICKLFNYY